MAHGALDADNRLRLLALAAGLRHNAEIGQPGLCFSAYGHKFGINHLGHEEAASGKSWAKVRARRLCPKIRKAPVCGLFQSSPGWTRTNNPPVNSRMLCQLSYRGRQPPDCTGALSLDPVRPSRPTQGEDGKRGPRNEHA